MIAEKLHEAIAAVCPIDGVSVGRASDKATWRVQYAARATAAERAAADAALAAFDAAAVVAPGPEPTAREILAALRGKGIDITSADLSAARLSLGGGK